MIEAFTQDIQRLIEVTPVQDVTGQVILANLYLAGQYKGIVNTVRPEEDSSTWLSVSYTGNATGTKIGLYLWSNFVGGLKVDFVGIGINGATAPTSL